MAPKKKSRTRLLSSTRHRSVKPTASLSSNATRSLVRTHHTLRKQLSSAVARGDCSEAESIKTRIEAAGGLRKYQEASIQGQSAERGGDTSKILVQWLSEVKSQEIVRGRSSGKLRMLEVGALRTDNRPDIEEQDFMEIPLPTIEDLHEKGFDIVSLSLVVNFVGDPAQRGEMLKRVATLLRPQANDGGETEEIFPGLFMVLPAPCVMNSRYLDEGRLEDMMQSLGYTQAKRKLSSKLIYYLWRWEGPVSGAARTFKKEEIRSGKLRNNFAIVLR